MTEPTDLDEIKAFIQKKVLTNKEQMYHTILDEIKTTDIVGKPAKELPDHLKYNPFVGVAPQPMQEIEVYEVCNSDHVNRGKLVVSEDKQTATAYLPEGVHVKKVNNKVIQQYLNENIFEIPLLGVVVLDIQPNEQRTCRWFSADEETIKDGRAELSNDYEFDRPHPWSVCSNPNIIKETKKPNPSCELAGQQGLCSFYEPEPKKLVRSIVLNFNDAEPLHVYVRATRIAFGARRYIITAGLTGNPEEVEFTLSGLDHLDKLDDVLEEKLAEYIAELAPASMEELPIEEPAEEKNRYFDYVLEG